MAHRFSLFQTDYWNTFQKALGREVGSLKLGEGEAIRLIKYPLSLGPIKSSWLLGVGVNMKSLSKERLDYLKIKAKEMGCSHIRFEGHAMDDTKALIGAVQAHMSYLPQFTIKVGLSASEEDILAQMKRKGRYNIKLAEKNGVEVKSYEGGSVPKEVFENLYTVLSDTAKRDGFSIHPASFYRTMLESLKNMSRLYIAYHNGALIGGIVVVYTESEAIYYYGASSNEHRNLMAPYLLQWRAMADAKKAGKKWYDFMGVAKCINMGDAEEISSKEAEFDKNDPLHGVTDFKRKFGGKVVRFGEPKEVVLKPLLYRGMVILKKLRG